MSFLKKYKKFGSISISIVIIFFSTILYVTGIPFFDLMELKTIDLRFISRGNKSPGHEVVLAVVDEKSIDKEGKWVWPRTKIADLINKLSDAESKVVGFDIGFVDPDDKGVLKLIGGIQNKVNFFGVQNKSFDKYLNELKVLSDHDEILADAIKKSKSKIVLGYFFQTESTSQSHVTEEEIKVNHESIKGSKFNIVRYESKSALKLSFLETKMPEANIPKISSASPYCGFFNMFPDSDGVVRRSPAILSFKEDLYAPLALKCLSAYLDSPLSVYIADYGIREIGLDKVKIPTDEYGRITINYRGEDRIFPHISVTDILNGEIAKDVLKDKIVLVGVTAVAVYDLRVTPFSTVAPGLEVHANIIDSILKEDFLYQPSWAAIFDVLAFSLESLFIGAALPFLGIISGLITCFLLFICHIYLCNYLFSHSGIILNLVYPLVTIIVTYGAGTVYQYFLESSQKKFIKDAFSTYLAPNVVKQLIDSPEKLVLGGEQRQITAFFSDVQGFTSISEKLSPSDLVELLNEFLTEMTDIILKYEGTVDKFEGDAIIAFFGAPNDMPDHGQVACMACIDMQKRLSELRESWRQRNKPELKMRIGLCSGSAVVGNMGSKSRMDYTMMGDTVNTAARLEGVNKVYGTYVLVSNSTFKYTDERVVSRELDSIIVVGKIEPVPVYEIVGFRKEISPKMLKVLDSYSEGLSAYRRKEWDNAINLFNAALSLQPDDPPSKIMIDRCKEYKLKPPPDNWNGAFTMKSK
ncbi:MAG: CHASE2 domain-containing protein [Desulfobacterales bacterium]|nr:CHASE2 domain-containing protein [Desulfobacterales bacterium]